MRSSNRSFFKPAVRSTNKSFFKPVARSVNKPLFKPVVRSTNKTFAKSVANTNKTNLALRRAVVRDKPSIKNVAKLDKGILKKGASPFKQVAKIDKSTLKKGFAPSLVQRSSLRAGKLDFAKLPLHKAVAPDARHVGRLGVPRDVTPKLTLAGAPNSNAHARFEPFVQRHWRKAFFWVAVAGVGYVTVPEIYYDRFSRCTEVDNPDYDQCISVLSYAALEEEEQVGRVRLPMPATASYRYIAKAAPTPPTPTPQALPRETPTAEARQTCSFEPFVERQWNRSFVWVQIPQTGNVTVPEDFYDRFYGKVGAEPPDYPEACKVLVEAAAADTVATASLDLERKL